MESIKQEYLGDGVYAVFVGYAIWLRANDLQNPTDQICIDPDVLHNLNSFALRCNELKQSQLQSPKKTDRPNCYKCFYRTEIPGDCHSSCSNKNALVTGDKHGIKNGWFFWPFNFDPTWLISCNGFKEATREDVQSEW